MQGYALVVPDSSGLAGAPAEKKALAEIFTRRGARTRARRSPSPKYVGNLLETGGYGIFHVISHAMPSDDASSGAVLLLQNNTSLLPRALRGRW